MQKQLMFFFDFNKCIDCKTCEMSCNDYHGLRGVHRRQVVTYDMEGQRPVHISMSCNHCYNPVCILICPENNYMKRSDGVVILTPVNCQGCERCVKACPFHAPKINPQTNQVDKCNLCVERLDEGLKPVCVENCTTGAIGVIEVDLKERRKYNLGDSGVPVANFTNPSILIKQKQQGQIIYREG